MSERPNSAEYLYSHMIAEEQRKRKETERKNAELVSENKELAKRAADAERKNMIFSEILFNEELDKESPDFNQGRNCRFFFSRRRQICAFVRPQKIYI